MLFKKRKEEPPRVDEASAAQRATLEQKVVNLATRAKEAERLVDELRGQLKARDDEIAQLKMKNETLHKEIEKRSAASSKAPEVVDPFAIAPNAELPALESLLTRLDQKTGDIRAMVQAKRDEATAVAAQRKVGELEKRLGDIDPLFGPEVDVLRKDVQRAGSDLGTLDAVSTAISDLESREDAKREQLLENLRKWKESGFVVTPLETISAGSLADLDREFKKFESDVARTNALLARLDRLQDVGASENIRTKLKDPTIHAQVEQDIMALEAASTAKAKATGAPKERERPTAAVPTPTPADAGATGGTDDVDAIILKADEMLERARKAGKDVNTPTNLLRLAKSFQRSKNLDKARQYAERASKMAEGTLQ